MIDAHQHFWNYKPERDTWIKDEMDVIKKDFSPVDLKKELDANRIIGCVAVQASSTVEETSFLLDIAKQHDFVKGVVGWIDLLDAHVEERLKHYKRTEPLLKGFRHIVEGELDNHFILREDFLRGIGMLHQYDYTYDLLINPRQLGTTIKFLSYFPEQKFVVDHIAKPYIKEKVIDPWAEQIKQIATHPNVYCKISGIITEANWNSWHEEDLLPYIEVVFNEFGSDRLMFGSDWPVCLLAGTYSQVMNIVSDFIEKNGSGTDRQALMGGTATKFYTL